MRARKKKQLLRISLYILSAFFLVLLVYLGYQWWLYRKAKFVRYPEFGISSPDEYPIHGIDVSRYQEIIDRANALDTPERYKAAKDYLIKSVEAEKQSNEGFRNYLVTGDRGEYERSVDLFSQALQYSTSYDAAINEAG